MYLPTGSALLGVLQLPLFFSNSILRFGAPDEESTSIDRSQILNNLGNIAPYHDAPAVPGVSADLPDDCNVDRVILLHRHGSRGPASVGKYIGQLVDTLARAQDKIDDTDLPAELAFLKKGYQSHLVADNLTIIGRQQLFNHGVEFALRYPAFSTDVISSTAVPRVVESAHFFAQGFFGLDAEQNVEFLTTDDFDDPVSWLAPYLNCPKLRVSEATQASKTWGAKYVPRIQDRLNKLIPGVELSSGDIRGALNACPYDLAARDKSPWCNVFTANELEDFEYDIDLYLDIYSDHDKSEGSPGSLVGAIYVQKLIERLTDESTNAKSLYLDFAHDYSILFALTALGVNKDGRPLTPDAPVPDRKFKSSNLTPFAANMVWEKFTCKNTFAGPQVRLLVNGATLPLTNCEKTKKDRQYGTCSLDAFKEANKFNMGVEYESEQWETTCGYPKTHA